MVGGDGVSQHRQHACAVDILYRIGRHPHFIKERRQSDIGGIILPFIGVGSRNVDRLPLRRSGKDRRIFFVKHPGRDLLHRFGYLGAGRPDIFQVDRVPLAVLPQRVVGQIHPHIPGQRVGHHQRRRGQPVGFHQWVNTALKVTVTGKHRANRQIALLDGILNRIRQRAGVTDTGGTAIADEVKTKLVKIRRKTRMGQIVRDYLRPWRQRGFNPRFWLQA